MSEQKINSEEIARRAGVSRSTVSKVINNYGDVGQDTKTRVLKVIKECGYSPNLAARILAGKGIETIGLFFLLQSGEDYPLSQDSIVDQMMAVVIDEAARMGFLTLTVIIRNMDEGGEYKIQEIFRQGRIDAGIFLGCRSSEPVIDQLAQQGYLTGILDYPRPRQQGTNRIIVNFDPLSAEKAVEHLYSLGHRKIMGVQGDQFRFDGKQKYEVFLKALKQRGIELRPEWDLKSSFYLGDSRRVMEEFLEAGHEMPTAVFCANDHIAYGVLRALKSRGIDVPGDVSVIGIDDAILSAYMNPPLTSLRADFSTVLKTLTKEVIGAVSKPPGTPVYIESTATLIKRESCKENVK